MTASPLQSSTTPLLPTSLNDQEPRIHARTLYWCGWRLSRISELLDIPPPTLSAWKKRDKWDEASPIERAESALEARYITLVMKDKKEACDYKEIDLLGRQLERAARIRRYQAGGNEVDLNPKLAAQNAGPKKKPERNVVTDQAAALRERFLAGLYDYQKQWYESGRLYRIRNILKSRQIGATWYFAREALIDAIETGRNQIFLSASKAQSHVFRQYIVAFAAEVGAELSGSPIVLDNGAALYFLSCNSRTAQSYHGNLYFDEYFWTQNFTELRKVASGMALHRKWRQTYFSTPSSINHAAYPFWNGELYNARRPKNEQAQFALGHEALSRGALGPDKHWRQIVTVEDAIKGGCDLFDLADLKLEYGPEEYANLLMCQFVDDTESIFKMALIMRAMVDSWDLWTDYRPFAVRPFGEEDVWIGYDPSSSGDSAAVSIVAPPKVPGGKFRILEREQFRDMDFDAQANAIRGVCLRYHVTHIAIDATGMGLGVFELVKTFFPAVEKITYSVEVKNGLVLKGLDVFNRGRIEFDAGWVDMAQSFMAIRKATTDSGRQMTYKADRSAAVSHADLAWATLHALYHEPLSVGAGEAGTHSSFMEFV